MDKIPYMPELESVELSGNKKMALGGQIFVCFTVSVLMVIAFWGASILLQMPSNTLYERRVMASMVTFLIILPPVTFYRFLSANFYAKTDTDGIFVQSLLHKRFMLWDDVVDVKSRKSLWGTSLYFLKSNTLSVTIRVNENDLRLIASIWQNLNKHGKSRIIQLPKSIFPSQNVFPTQIPGRIDWVNPNPPNYIGYVILEIAIYMFLAGATVFFYIRFGNNLFQFSQMFLLFAYFAFMSRYVMYRTISVVPKHATLDGDVLHVDKYRKSVDIQLSQVKSATWEELDLRIVDQNKNMLFIPHINDDPVSTQLLLAIIRRLRQSPSLMFMPIPKELLNLKEDGS